jgi:hypothetical protein
MNIKEKHNVFYFPLESLKSRYTQQLSNEWIPQTFEKYKNKINFVVIEGDESANGDVQVGQVLDAIGRGKFALQQCKNFLDKISAGEVKNGDTIFLQEFWTAGVESIFYALDLYNIKVNVYSTLWAQSVDMYDFTYNMRNWMRPYEIGLSRRLNGIFVASTIHRDELKAAGFECPIHVVSLTVDSKLVKNKINKTDKNKTSKVVYTSRYDSEKNPFFMLEVAKKFLKRYPKWEWVCTTSASKLRSNMPGIVDALYKFAQEEPRFKIKENLTKEQYYEELSSASVQFNSALQDYVSFTGVEASIFRCNLVYPDFRSFKEMIPPRLRYTAFNVESAIQTLDNAIHYTSDNETNLYTNNIIENSDYGRELMCYIIVNGIDREYNIWHEKEAIKYLINHNE